MGIDSTLLMQHRWKDGPERKRSRLLVIMAIYRVQCYPSQLNQAFMNILANAIDTPRRAS
jgi:signal transduction histidine kinase